MYAVVTTGGKQIKVENDTVAVVEKIDAPVGDTVTLPVLFIADGDAILFGDDAAAVTVTATIIEHFKGEKQIVFKFKKRKGYKKHEGSPPAADGGAHHRYRRRRSQEGREGRQGRGNRCTKRLPRSRPAKKPAQPRAAAAKETTVAEKPAAKKPRGQEVCGRGSARSRPPRSLQRRRPPRTPTRPPNSIEGVVNDGS